MTLSDLKKIGMYQTRAISEANKDRETALYVMTCLDRFFAGDFGKIPEEDTAANMQELASGEGRALARYERRGKLREDIYINCYFSASNPGDIDYNNTLIMYVSEY